MSASEGSASPVEVAIVVVSYASSSLLEENLGALDRAALGDPLVVVVDNRTTEAERHRTRALAERFGWEVVAPEENLGFGEGMNRGAERALRSGATHLLLLNPDVILTAAEVRRLVTAADGHRGALSPRIVRPGGGLWFAGGQLDWRTGLTSSRVDELQTDPHRWLTGACLLVDAATWRSVGGFRPEYFLYWEDIDLSHRIAARGSDLRVVHEVEVTHTVGATQAGRGKSALYCRYVCRNRLLFARLHVPARQRWRWAIEAPRFAARVLQRDGRRAALLRPDRLLAAVRGTLEGLWILSRRGPAEQRGPA